MSDRGRSRPRACAFHALLLVRRARRARTGARAAARWDLRVVVSGGHVVGAARRVAAPGEWRTNVALGGRIERAAAPPLAQRLALEAASAVRGDLVGIDLLPLGDGYIVSEVNGAVDFRPAYALGPGNVFRNAVHELVRVAQLKRIAA